MDKVLNFGNAIMAIAIFAFSVTMLVMGGLSTFALIGVILLTLGSLLVSLYHLYHAGVWLYNKVQEVDDDTPVQTTVGGGLDSRKRKAA